MTVLARIAVVLAAGGFGGCAGWCAGVLIAPHEMGTATAEVVAASTVIGAMAGVSVAVAVLS